VHREHGHDKQNVATFSGDRPEEHPDLLHGRARRVTQAIMLSADIKG